MKTELAPKFSISEEDMTEMASHAVAKVLKTMVSLEAVYKETVSFPENTGQPAPKPIITEKPMIAGSVGFTGKVSGIVYLYAESELATRIAENMLGMTPEEIEEEGEETLNDVFGEITNMTVGTFKNQLCDKGYNCMLTIPTVLLGRDFAVQSKFSSHMFRKFFKYRIEDWDLVMDIIMEEVHDA